MLKNTKNTYKVKELIETLQEMLEKHEGLTEDSPILICDKDLGEFKENFKVHYVNRYGEGSIGLFFEEEKEEEKPKRKFFSTILKHEFDKF